MVRTQLSVSKRVTLCASFAALALILSYIEALSGINSVMPIPGTKLGLANIAVTVIVYLMPVYYGLAISLVRVGIVALLFGNVTSLLFSFLGALCAFAFLVFAKLVLRDKVSLIGASVGASAFHMVGQLVAASLVLGSGDVLGLLPMYLLFAALTGVVTGIVSQIIYLCAEGIGRRA